MFCRCHKPACLERKKSNFFPDSHLSAFHILPFFNLNSRATRHIIMKPPYNTEKGFKNMQLSIFKVKT